MATITKRRASWLVRWYTLDGRQVGRSCPDKRTADKLALEVERLRALGSDWAPAVTRSTLEDVVAGYLKYVARTKRPTTLTVYGDMLLRFVAFAGADEGAAKALTLRSLTDYYDHLGDGVSESSRQQYVHAVHRLWAWAYDSDEHRDEVQRPRRLEMRAQESTPTVAPTWAECDACLAALRPRTAAYRAALVMRYTGLRVGQACRLLFGDFNTERGTLTVRGQLGKSRSERTGRIVPVSQHLLDELRAWGGKATDTVVGAASVDVAIRHAWERSGVRAEAWSGRPDHAFRKAFVSELRRAGADPDAVEYLVGHSSGIRGVYTDPAALPLAAAVALVTEAKITARSGVVVALRK